ncbi:NAD(P)(+)--arginine ADP-ribosyltransferase 2-like [Aythya fuligula]|uniref:NAD(P)(+)--arginine ADP-ribosyltransferase n=1 Tax=Aythya fuligula TaxID=219594 RepID=A0A6J3EPI2_AYTFU|nr:NAD(P)(+)--arginine ADP-ribosyltransferase 2-like [Aythya fuligula]
MEHLGLGWVLLAGTLAGTLAASSTREQDPVPIKKVAMDMAQNSFDDQYRGCRYKMEVALEMVNCTEFQNPLYADAWSKAKEKWQNSNHPQVLQWEYAVAVLAYTDNTGLYSEFNRAVCEGGRSREHYLECFQFKTMHFLLTEALHTLRKAQGRRCYDVYRGVKGIHFTARRHQTVRFGQFASTSLKENATKRFGQDTLFIVHTCYGVPIQDFSFYPDEEEVLIPPYEVFKVTNVMSYSSRSIIHLHSHGVCSNYNCALVNVPGKIMEKIIPGVIEKHLRDKAVTGHTKQRVQRYIRLTAS